MTVAQNFMRQMNCRITGSGTALSGIYAGMVGSQVIVHLIADGRRDMQSVLARRLLG